MLNRTRFVVLYVLFWIAFFECGRLLFLLYNWKNTATLDPIVALGTLLHGLRLDVSGACALALVPACVVARAGFIPDRVTRLVVQGYTLGLIALVGIVIVADLEIFRVWGYHLVANSLRYLSSPREAFASASGSPLPWLLAILVIVVAVMTIGFRRGVLPLLASMRPISQGRSLLLLVTFLPTLAIGALGGFRWRVPLAAGSVYFSRDNFANQAAVNPAWNFFVSATGASEEGAVEIFADSQIAESIVDSLLARLEASRPSASATLLRGRPSKVILLLWEGLTAKVVEPLGGRRDVTPGFTALAHEGVLFDSLFASGPRTTNGLVALLSGLPSHPRTNPLESEERVAALPSLSKSMAAAGYHTAFYYGAPLEFDNRNRYLLHGDYDVILEKKDIDRRYWNSAWGPHDPYVLDRLFRAVDSAKSPIFAVTLTLSSHEPFRVPLPALIPGDDTERRFLNSQAYTDRAVSNFVDRLRRAPWWGSTLLIIVADHGSPYPSGGSRLAAAPEHYRIPMLWVGGGVAVRNTVIHRIGSQTDVAATLLAQLGIDASQFTWGRDMLAPGRPGFAFYSFADGFGFVDDEGSYVFDNVSKAVMSQKGNPTSASLAAGRAFQQMVMEHYLALVTSR